MTRGVSYRWLVTIILAVLAFLHLMTNSANGRNTMSSSTTTNVMSLESAITTLRCLVTPNCFPSAKCRVAASVPQKIRREGEIYRLEEHAFCVQDVLEQPKLNENDGNRATKQQKQKSGCLIYSFGIHDSWEWEAKVARLLHCEVHAFDPTMDHPTNLAPNKTFHKLGLQAEGTDTTATHSVGYRAIDPKRVLSLDQIMARLGHTGRTIDVLALDCEGCEWGALKQLACGTGQSHLVRQLFIEFHFQTNLGLASSADVILAGQGIQCLWNERWRITSIEPSSASSFDWSYTKGMSQVVHTPGFLMFASFRRIPHDELLPSEQLEKVAEAFRTNDPGAIEANNLLVNISKPSTVKFDTTRRYDP